MVRELTKAFLDPLRTSKVTFPLSSYKVLEDLNSTLFKTPKVEEEMVQQVGNIRPLSMNPELHRALETSFEAAMAFWQIGWYSTVLINYLFGKCKGDPILEAVCTFLHGAIQESHPSSAWAASMTVAAQFRMVLNNSTFQDCLPLQATLLCTLFVGPLSRKPCMVSSS